jgi:hypothetical protein
VLSFKALSEEMLGDPDFQALYEGECNVCTSTMRIFARLHAEKQDCTELARALGVGHAALTALEDAEHCDPHLAIRLCRHLNLPIPENCPRLKNKDNE